jgi:NAD(P)-dependent dehydrogenase (short-subunit alcohol dehydrogenase family)
VTGAAQGIGRVIAARLLTAGATVCLWDRAPEALTSTAHDLRTLGPVEAGTQVETRARPPDDHYAPELVDR